MTFNQHYDPFAAQAQHRQTQASIAALSSHNASLQTHISTSLAEQKELVDTLYKNLHSAIDQITQLNDTIKLLETKNELLVSSLEATQAKYSVLDRFVEMCTNEFPKLLTRLAVMTGARDCELSGCITDIQTKLITVEPVETVDPSTL